MTAFVAQEGVVHVTGLWVHSQALAALTIHTWGFYCHPQGALHKHSSGPLAPARAMLEERWSPVNCAWPQTRLSCGLAWPQPCLVTVNVPINCWMWFWTMHGLSGLALHPSPCHDFAFYRSCPLVEPGHGLWGCLAQVLWGRDQSRDTLALLLCPSLLSCKELWKERVFNSVNFL